MGCCENKNLSMKFPSEGELGPTDSISRVSDKYNGNNISVVGLNEREGSNIAIKLQKINFDFAEQKKVDEEYDKSYKQQQSPFISLTPFIPLTNIAEKESSLIKNIRLEKLKMLSPSRRLNNGNNHLIRFSLADQSPSSKVFPFYSNKFGSAIQNNNNNIWGSNLTDESRSLILINQYFYLLIFNSASSKLFPFMFQPSDLVTLKINSIYEDYQIGKILGEGGYSKVFEVSDKQTNIKRALKCIRKLNQKDFSEKVLKEVRILKTLDHPNMVRIIDFYETPDEFQIVTELCTGGELFYKISECQQFDEAMACNIMHQILSCLEYCHRHHIVHLDIKPENLIFESLDSGALLKLIDFGTSTFYNPQEQMTRKIGTPAYMAPEVYKSNYNEKCDIWSCGVILYVLLSGSLPFGGETDTEIQNLVLNKEVSFQDEEWLFVSGDAKQFIRRLLDKNPMARYSASQSLTDPWMIRYGQKKEMQTSSVNMNKTLDNLKNYKNTKQFQKVVWTVIAQYLVSKQEQEEVLKTFRVLDLNEDGQLSREELILGYQKIYGNEEKVMNEVDRIMNNVDQNKNNFIDYSEFLMATINREDFLTDEKLETVFHIIDKDQSGRISFESVKKLFQECDKNVPAEFWKKLLDEFSRYENGYVMTQIIYLYNFEYIYSFMKLDLTNFKLFMKKSIRKLSTQRIEN